MSLPPDQRSHIEESLSQDEEKIALRRSLLLMRCALDDALRAELNQKISEYIEQHLQAHAITTLGVYFSTRHEPDLLNLYSMLSKKGIMLSLPVVMGKTAPLQFAKWKPGDALVKDRFGISNPAVSKFVELPQALLVPCLGFTRKRYRLGYGGGYFDRTLEAEPRPYTMGIAYSCLETSFVARKYDIPLDCIITESGII